MDKAVITREMRELEEELQVYENRVINNCRDWLVAETEQNRISGLCSTFCGFFELANLPMEDEDFVLIGMHFISLYTDEFLYDKQAEVLEILAQKMGFKIALEKMADENG